MVLIAENGHFALVDVTPSWWRPEMAQDATLMHRLDWFAGHQASSDKMRVSLFLGSRVDASLSATCFWGHGEANLTLSWKDCETHRQKLVAKLEQFAEFLPVRQTT